MANENKNKRNAGANVAAQIEGANGVAQIEGAKNNEGGTAAGAKKSTGPQLPVSSTPSGGTAIRVSPQAIASMVGQSLKAAMGGGKRMPKIPGLPKASGGGRTSNGEKPLLLAIFFVVYAKWTDFLRFVAWGQVKNIFVVGAEQTVENRIVMVGGPDGNVAYQGVFSGVAAWFKETLNLDVVRGENGAWATPAGYTVVPVWDINEKCAAELKIASFRKNADIAEHFAKLATETQDAELKAEYEGKATYYGEASKYDGWCCTTTENAQKVADNVRRFYSLNPEAVSDFTELSTWTPVYGQAGLAEIENAHYPNTAEYAAEQAAEQAEAEKAEVQEA